MYASKKKREEIARNMFRMRFADDTVENRSINDLRTEEGRRVKKLYQEKGHKYGVTWKGRDYNPSNWALADNINRAVSAANASLYALCTAIVCSLGYLPTLGFIHSAGTMPFVFDIADIYKPETTLEAAFQTISINPKADEKETITRLKTHIEKQNLLRRIPRDIENLLEVKKSTRK